MRDLDDTDRRILRLLMEDGRRSYADIADRVDLSSPAVSDRVERLQELGVVERFTVDVDRSTLREGVQVLVSVAAEHPGQVRRALAEEPAAEHVFETAEGRVVATLTLPPDEVRERLAETVGVDAVESVDLLVDADWSPGLGEATIGVDCAECGNTVTEEGTSLERDGTVYAFCCESCEAAFAERYDELREGV